MEHTLEHLSVSSLNSYQKCPRAWALHYIDRVEEKPSLPAAVGSFVHYILETLIGKSVPQSRTLDCALALCKKLWDKETTDSEPAYLLDRTWHTKQTKHLIANCIKNYFTLEDPTEVKYFEIEQTKHYQLTDELKFKYILDRLDYHDGGLCIVDYKTGNLPDRRYVPEALLQLMIYGWLETQAGHDIVAAKMIYLGSKPGIIYFPDLQLHLDEIAKLFNRRTTKLLEVLDEPEPTFKPKVGPLCAWCSHVGSCAAGQQEVNRRLQTGSIRPDAPVFEILYNNDRNQ